MRIIQILPIKEIVNKLSERWHGKSARAIADVVIRETGPQSRRSITMVESQNPIGP